MMIGYVLGLLFFSPLVVSWNQDAGYIKSWTKMVGVSVNATSNPESAFQVLDNNDNTHWTSASCLPGFYISRPDENLLHGLCDSGACSDFSGLQKDWTKLTDGSLYNIEKVSLTTNKEGQHIAKFLMQLPVAWDLYMLSVWGVYNADTSLFISFENGTTEQIKVLNSSNNYQQIIINKVLPKVLVISLHSTQTFKIKEIAALSSIGCKESIVIDLGQKREVGVIQTRHWAGSGSASSLTLQTSIDSITWTAISNLVPDALHRVTTSVKPSRMVQYIKLEYTLVLKNYNKVYCWEVDAWDKNQQWGQPVVAKSQQNTLREILGVNGIWGWQHKTYSSNLKVGQGPTLYNAVASHARNYHNLDWDITDPSKNPQYDQMANGGGTQAKSWLNWDTEYKAWRNANLSIDVSIQFLNKNFPENEWQNPEQEAFNFGKHFSQHFGASSGNGLVNAVEVGNEPWDYHSSFYNTILKGMSAGLRNGDPVINILPGAFQAHDIHDTGNYIGTRVTQDLANNISVLNFHTYSYRTNSNGIRVATYPEHEDSSFNSIRNIVRWRDSNMPSKPIWITEWGWDADGKGENCQFSECVSEEAQAIYGLRALFIISRSNIQRATWFFYANSESCNTLYCRSGLTTSISHNFTKKNVFHAFEEMHSLIGSAYFIGIYKEDASGYIYLFGSSPLPVNTNASTQELLKHTSYLVGWKPVDVSDPSTSKNIIQLPPGIYPSCIKEFSGTIPPIKDKGFTNFQHNSLSIDLSSHPVVVKLLSVDTGHIVW